MTRAVVTQVMSLSILLRSAVALVPGRHGNKVDFYGVRSTTVYIIIIVVVVIVFIARHDTTRMARG